MNDRSCIAARQTRAAGNRHKIGLTGLFEAPRLTENLVGIAAKLLIAEANSHWHSYSGPSSGCQRHPGRTRLFTSWKLLRQPVDDDEVLAGRAEMRRLLVLLEAAHGNGGAGRALRPRTLLCALFRGKIVDMRREVRHTGFDIGGKFRDLNHAVAVAVALMQRLDQGRGEDTMSELVGFQRGLAGGGGR